MIKPLKASKPVMASKSKVKKVENKKEEKMVSEDSDEDEM